MSDTKLDAARVRTSLAKHAGHLLTLEASNKIMDGFRNDGLVEADETGRHLFAAAATTRDGSQIASMSAARAANPEKRQAFDAVAAMCARLGYTIDESRPIDVAAMNKAFAGQNVDQRLWVKIELARLGLIP